MKETEYQHSLQGFAELKYIERNKQERLAFLEKD